eukprot:CAMPEP_0205831280 /NCGR_PEP_ID=MMETSP0206-20130828/43615_1 /ASSEMBLY_ACC=CAM_ASM_000279 /TAXON_ID=36767 /ORGANISM="Euplotes focardii, Strain TN1" /LENGTH=201 /DNA_ID=CAMNT_0053135765 /DNA_START=1 /DNA_END=602 /DNA_ORIENTATION=-
MTSPSNLSRLRYESTVGAGTPMVAALGRLLNGGDEVRMIQGTFSGTLGFVMSQLEAGQAYSEVVQEAHRKGYTEPDPRDDLGGTDVARKALILARTMGLKLEMADLQPQPLFPDELAQLPVPEFLAGLTSLNAQYEGQVQKARNQDQVLRYVATIEDGKCEVGLKSVAKLTPMGQLNGTDNLIEIHTDVYRETPLVVQGAG